MPVADLHAVLQYFHKTGLVRDHRLIDCVDQGLFQIVFENFGQLSHNVRLRFRQKLHQHFTVHSEKPIIMGRFADAVSVH